MIHKLILSNRHPLGWRLFFFLTLVMCCTSQGIFAHQTPSTIVLLDVNPKAVSVELQLPLGELELAFGHEITKDPEHLIEKFGSQLKEYLLAHIHPMTEKNKPWIVEVTNMIVGKAEQTGSGQYQEITVQLVLIPPTGESTRKFIFDYDVIMHQLVTHSALVSIRSDWELGQTNKEPVKAGVIRVDTQSSLIYPLEINLEKGGNWWTGFKGMFFLGMEHIREGTDHLLFLLVLLLPAPLVIKRKQWGNFGGTKYSIMRLLKIVTAFTIGHSVTLLIGASGWVNLPVKPVEILIAVSILISAIHAIYPIFPNKEVYVAAGFGLVHGLAFATVLSVLNLDAGVMALSILSFNIGIEIMQMFVVILIIPWLILLSQTPVYKWVRVVWALLAGIASLAWISERVFEKPNKISILIQNNYGLAPWGIFMLALFSLTIFGGHYWIKRKKNTNQSTIS
ncbi:HupE/UreJ family protein [Flavobacterium soyae]|uniref:HupE/UreJ family protein n=1 Tax=Flavobacterium soyae TaxID=2903098 RepID=UPI001E5F3B6D|nr:HupE/UreJ family protein [Flavobacterium soyae]MCD9575380.1 HupE/UreJ family protein [Flavobacterium soyae]